jgi:tetratricopeptide (TPR) repeat protein
MRRAIVLGLLWFGTVGVFWQAKDHLFFPMDDGINTWANPYLNYPKENVTRFWKRPYQGLYIPVAYTAWAVEMKLARQFGVQTNTPDPRFFHVGNICLHATNSVLVYLILAGLFGGWAAAFGALCFALHPIQVEAVVWISCLRDLLSAFFGLLSVGAYLVFLKAMHRRRWPVYAAAFLCFLLGLLSKPSLAALPLICLALEWGLFRRPLREAFLHLAPWVLPSVVISYLTHSAQWFSPFLSTLTWSNRLHGAADALHFYLLKFLLPLGLVPDYGHSPDAVLHHGVLVLIPVLGLLALAVIDRDRRLWISAFGVFLGGVLPVLGLVPFEFQNYSTVADRYAYLAMLAFAMVGARLSERFRAPWVAATGMVLLATYVAQDVPQIRFWKDPAELFTYTLKENPESVMAHEFLGRDAASLGRFSEAIDHFQASVRKNPYWVNIRAELATTLMQTRRYREAERHFAELVRLMPYSTDYNRRLAEAELALGDAKAALDPLKLVMERSPSASDYNRLGVAYFLIGSKETALRTFAEGESRFPESNEISLNWGAVLERCHEDRAAIALYDKILDRRPDETARERQAKLWGKLGNWEEAARQYRKLFFFSGHQSAARLAQMGEALFRSRHRQEALEAYRAAVHLDPHYLPAEKALRELRSGKALSDAVSGPPSEWVGIPYAAKLSE